MRAFVVVLLSALLPLVLGGIIFHVPSNDEVCFGEELGYDLLVHDKSIVTAGGNDAHLKVVVVQTTLEDDGNSKPTTVWSKDGNDGSFGFTTEKQGEFRFCFSSTSSSGHSELEVDFDLRVGFEAKDYVEVAKKEHLQPIEVELLKLNDAATEIWHELNVIRARELTHRETTDNTSSAVTGWSIVSLVVIVVLGVYQTIYLRSYFKRKKLI